MLVRAARLIVFIGFCSSLGAPSFGAQPGKPLSLLEIRDVDNSPIPSKEGRLICRVEARSDEDRRFVKGLWDGYGPVFGFKDWNNLGPDSMYRQLRLVHEIKTLTLRSWHPIYERDRKLIVTSHGVTTLGKRSRAEVLRKDNQTYVKRRAAFDTLLERCLMHNRPTPKRVKRAGG